MKKCILSALVLSLMVVSISHAETWKSYYTSNDGNKYLIDTASTATSGDGTEVTANGMWKFANPAKYNGVSKVKMVLKANCFDKELYSSGSTAYNSKGKVVNKDNEMTTLDTSSNPVNAAAFQFLCKGK